jgi:hypothetical protein
MATRNRRAAGVGGAVPREPNAEEPLRVMIYQQGATRPLASTGNASIVRATIMAFGHVVEASDVLEQLLERASRTEAARG